MLKQDASRSTFEFQDELKVSLRKCAAQWLERF